MKNTGVFIITTNLIKMKMPGIGIELNFEDTQYIPKYGMPHQFSITLKILFIEVYINFYKKEVVLFDGIENE